MFRIFRNRNFALLWSGQFISSIGDWVWIVALPFYVYQLTGSALATGTMFMVETLPRLFLGSVAGVFVDRLNRRWTMIVSDTLRAGLLLLLLLVRTGEHIWIIYLIALMQTLIAQFFNPAYYATIPKILGEKDLITANSLDTLIDAVTRLAGATAGGALFGFLGIVGVALVDSFSFLVSAVTIFLMVIPPVTAALSSASASTEALTQGIKQAVMRFWHQWREGLGLVVRNRSLMVLFSSTGLLMLAQGMISAIFVIFVSLILHGDATLFGWLVIAQGLGSLVGTFLASRLSNRLQPTQFILVGISVLGPLFFLLVDIPVTPLVFACRVLGGIFVVLFSIGSRTLIQQAVADEFRGRIFGFYGATYNGLMLIGLALSSSLGDWLGIVPLLNTAAVIFCIAGLLTWLLLRSKPQKEDREDVPSDSVEEAQNCVN
jgi:MFS family permease